MCVEISRAVKERKSDVSHAQFIIQVGSLHTAQSQIGKCVHCHCYLLYTYIPSY
jgi:hypothetical protein